MSRSVLLYGDVNVSYRDGSRIWLESMAEVLELTGSRVTVLLKAFPAEGTAPFGAGLACAVEEPSTDHRSRGAGMTPAEARERILELHAREHFDIVLTRGYAIAKELSDCKELAGLLWPYITDGPGFTPFHDGGHEDDLARIAQHARRVLVQTEDARSVWEACVPAATGKTLLLPPMVPDRYFRDPQVPAEDRRGTEAAPLRLVYSGKFAREWKSLEIPFLPERLSRAGVRATLRMVGDKIHHSRADAPFPAEMRTVMARHADGVSWDGGLERDEALALVSAADLGLGWRDASLDTSLEISTKLLEYAAAGVAPVVNRTRAHERLLGTDYPLFVDEDVTAALIRGCDPQVRHDAAHRAHEAVQQHRSSACAERLERCFAALEPDLVSSPPLPSPHEDGRPLRVLFASHDFKFSGELIDVLEQREDIELRIDTWQRLAQHDPVASAVDGDWADVIICEWAGHNAVFHSRRKRPDQRLIVRFHGFEIRGAWLKDIVVDAVDAFVFVSDFYRRDILEQTGWPESRTTVIPNVIDVLDLQRDKLPDARYHLGLAGYVPMLKRPDRAVDLLETLLEHDEGFTLHLRGRAPWSYPWEWAKPLQRSAYEALLERVRSSPRLREKVLFEEFSPDMGSWFRGIGWILSPSVKETFHLAPVEGMASGAVPLVWSRPGAAEIFGEALFEDVDEIARTILETLETPGAFEGLSRTSRELAQSFDMTAHRRAWLDLLVAERSTPLPLRGVPLSQLEEGQAPRSAAQVAAVLEDALAVGDLALARESMASPAAHAPEGSHLDARLRSLRERALLRDGVASGRWIPPAGLGRLHRVPAGADASLEASTVVDVEELTATTVLTAADALVTAVRRERPVRLVAPAAAAGAIATAIAARRTGVDLELPDDAQRALAAAEAEIPGLSSSLQDALARTAEPVALGDLVVGLIADEFTARAVSRTVRTVALPRRGWEQVLEETPVDVILVESAWSAPGEDWFHGVAYHGDEQAADLRAILAHARGAGLPTVFWNREDPVHLNSFLVPAADFDTVLTSDAACIPQYLGTLPSRTALTASLPFFADPAVFHPAPRTAADGGPGGDPAQVAYAGSYYGQRYPERTRELREILEVSAEHGLAIYDRQAVLPQSPYRLPDDLAAFSRGAASAAQMPDVYRRHPVHVNVNSVSASPTMFSRRVVEIAASGSLVLSGRGDGVRSVLGPAFPVLPDADSWRAVLADVAVDPAAWRSRTWEQLRTVRRQATSAHALALALRTAGLPVAAPSEPEYAVLVPASLRGAAEVLLSQTLPPAAIGIGLDHPERSAFAATGIPLVPLDQAAADLGRLIGEDGFVGVLAEALPPTHYEDLLLACAAGEVDQILVREEPAEDEDPFSLVSAVQPPRDEIVGALYSRKVARTAHDLARAPGDRAFVWIRGAHGAARPRGGA